MGRTSLTVQSYYPEQTRQLLEKLTDWPENRPIQLIGFGNDMKWLCRLLEDRISGIYDCRPEFFDYDIGDLLICDLDCITNKSSGLVVCPPELELIEQLLRKIIATPALNTMPVLWNTPYAYEPLSHEPDVRIIAKQAGQRAVSVNSNDRLFNLIQAVRETKGLSGDIVECGTFEGGTASLIWETLQAQKDIRQLFLMDSFRGMPPHRLGVDKRWGGTFSNISLTEIRNRFSTCTAVRIIDGNILDTINEVSRPISMAHIDTDTYETTLAVTRHLWPLLEPGGLLLYDDYGFLPNCLPLKIAVDDFFEDINTSAFRFFLPSNGYLVRKND